MSKMPEGAETKTGEGRDLSAAVAAAAEALGVKPHQVGHKLDMSHFRSADGRSTPRDTVKVIGWINPDAPEEAPPAPAPRPPREDDDRPRGRARDREDRPRGRDREERPRGRDREDRPRGRDREDRPRGRDREDRPRGRDRDDRGRGRGRDRDDRPKRDDSGRKGAEEGTTEASDFAQAWFTTLLEHLKVEGTVEGTGSDERVHLRINPKSNAGRLIGRRGATLGAIRHLLGVALESHGSPVIDVDVDDDRSRERGEERGRDRDDRGRDRDDRKGRGRGDERSGHPEAKLRKLAKRAAEMAIETGKTITINLDLNSYDRRIVHVAVSEIEGASTTSIEKDDKKIVQVIPD
jgi:predicted RNA-binding protein Jag